METTKTVTVRPIYVIAEVIKRDWKKVYFGAVPYLEAMESLQNAQDSYGMDSAKDIVTYFLVNATTWRGETARAVKAELKAMFGIK